MNFFSGRGDGRRAIAAMLVLLLVLAAAANLQLAVLFSPLLILAALFMADPRIEAAVVELVHALGAARPRAKASLGFAPVFSFSPARSTGALGASGSRAPPLPAI
jgi:hypothetical protein